MTIILFIRHGESMANDGGVFAGQLDIELSKRGISQAQLLADWIYKNYKVDKIYASDLSRAYNTAKPLAKLFNLEINATKELREINSGDWQGKSFERLVENYANSYGVWLKDIGNAKCPNGESVKNLYERVWRKVNEIAVQNKGKTIAIFTHATPIRAVCCKLKGYDVGDMKDVAWVSNASVSEVTIDENKWSLAKESVDEYLTDMKTRFPANV